MALCRRTCQGQTTLCRADQPRCVRMLEAGGFSRARRVCQRSVLPRSERPSTSNPLLTRHVRNRRAGNPCTPSVTSNCRAFVGTRLSRTGRSSDPRRWSNGVAIRRRQQGKISQIDASIKKRRSATVHGAGERQFRTSTMAACDDGCVRCRVPGCIFTALVYGFQSIQVECR